MVSVITDLMIKTSIRDLFFVFLDLFLLVMLDFIWVHTDAKVGKVWRMIGAVRLDHGLTAVFLRCCQSYVIPEITEIFCIFLRHTLAIMGEVIIPMFII